MLETRYILSASLFADCTGDAVLTRIAGGETVCGNLDVSPAARARYNLSEEYASLGSTLLFYTKKCDHPVICSAGFAYSVEEIERILQSNLHRTADNAAIIGGWEYGGDRTSSRKTNPSVAHSRAWSMACGTISKTAEFDAQYSRWNGVVPSRPANAGAR